MIYGINRQKSAPVLGAHTPGQPGPFGTYTVEPDDDIDNQNDNEDALPDGEEVP